MGRILFFLLLALAVYVGWRWLRLQRSRPPASAGARAAGEAMVSCGVCGLNVPQSEALPAPAGDGRWFCCEEHRRQGSAAP